MNSKRIYFLLIGVIVLCFGGLIAGTYAINGLLTKQATSLTALKAKSAAFTQEQQSLAATKQQVKKYTALNQIAKAVVPQDKDQAEAVREIVNLADQYNITLAAISFPASTLGAAATATAAAPASANATPITPTKSISQLTAVKNIPGVYQLTITVQGDSNKPVPYDKFVSFLTALEHNRRTAQVSAITLEPNSTNRSLLSFHLTLNEYIKP
jgi:hypothetical protein